MNERILTFSLLMSYGRGSTQYLGLAARFKSGLACSRANLTVCPLMSDQPTSVLHRVHFGGKNGDYFCTHRLLGLNVKDGW